MPKFNVIIFADTPVQDTKTRNYGAYRLASHIRDNGYTCLVVNFSSAIDGEMYNEILKNTVGEETYMVGFSTTFMPMRIPGEPLSTEVPGRDRRETDILRFDTESMYSKRLIDEIAAGRQAPWFDCIKNLNSKTKIVFGGSGIGFFTDFQDVDNFIYGLSETMVIDYLDSVTGRSKKRLFNKVLDYDYKAQLPVWDFRKSKTSYTDYDFITPNETLSLEVARGCRFKCTYCSYPLIGQKNIDDYLKYKEVLKDELLENYNRWGITQYYIMDDTFNDTTEKLLMFKEVVNSLPFKIKFWCYTRLDLLAVHPEQITLLKEIGLEQTYMGVETFHPGAGKAVGKAMKAEKTKEALAKCKEVWGNDVHIQAGFMVGLPTEPEESIASTCDYLRDPECPIHESWVFPINIFDGKDTTEHGNHWIYKSEFDKNYDKHGYYFGEIKTAYDRVSWKKKEDCSGIYTFEQATELAASYDRSVPKRIYTGDFYKSSLNHPILSNRELTKNMSQQEYKDLLNSIDMTKLYFDTVIEQYFTPLLEKLKNDNTSRTN
jgi:hypothetical protein